jgi:hypothetical protein
MEIAQGPIRPSISPSTMNRTCALKGMETSSKRAIIRRKNAPAASWMPSQPPRGASNVRQTVAKIGTAGRRGAGYSPKAQHPEHRPKRLGTWGWGTRGEAEAMASPSKLWPALST